MQFANPEFFWLLVLLAPMIFWYIWKNRDAYATLQMSTSKGFSGSDRTIKYYLRHFLFVIRILVIILVIIVLARPQSVNRWQDEMTEGIDIVIVLDISSSMLAQDLKPNRLESSKNVAMEFISGRRNDRIGLV
ncbi:MAG: aerotolerance regulator BatA, partial [Bacteroides sp. SM23_62_1]